eukprot:TRINITY_DN20430_c0_g1_i1.p1 TRINITY_DN20430_c0_g1~~TRINITY_DN20430_c0_g1_i1.p1  ORF type:complete len:638 (+),score=110.19 TRINITY_DN20430_c0_g1_i1:76-1989(+)
MGQGSTRFCASPWTKTKSKQAVREAFEEKYGKPRPDIEHVVVLMLENRTFDNVLGVYMDQRMQRGEVQPSRWDVPGQTGRRLYSYTNTVKPHTSSEETHGGSSGSRSSPRQRSSAGVKFPAWSYDPRHEDVMSEECMSMPRGHPAEKFKLLNLCVYGETDPAEGAVPTLDGFAQQYYEREMHDLAEGEPWEDTTDFEKLRSPAMHVFLPEQMQVFTDIAENFACSDTYFASAPCQTWSNRLFASVGHCYGFVNNLSDCGGDYDHDKARVRETFLRLCEFTNETVFNRLQNHGVEWAIYQSDVALAVALNRRLNLPGEASRIYSMNDFFSHAELGQLPPFSWLEPQYLKHPIDGSPPTDMHPPHSVGLAQGLIASVYNALRSSEAWSKTLFIVTCDEGVGVFDHVPPPKAKAPKTDYGHTFQNLQYQKYQADPFERYGTRVPCLLATPLLDPKTVLRPDKEFSEYPFCHASIIRTVFDLFVDPECHLAGRDEVAPSFANLLLPTARPDLGPEKLDSQCLLPESSLARKFVEGSLRWNATPSPCSNPLLGKVMRGGCHSVGWLDENGDDGDRVLPGFLGLLRPQMSGKLSKCQTIGAGWGRGVQDDQETSGSTSCSDSSGDSSEVSDSDKPLVRRICIH